MNGMRKLLLPGIFFMLCLPMISAANLTVDYDAIHSGRETNLSAFNLSGVMPGESGLWAVDVEMGDQSRLYMKLAESDESENLCVEPENQTEPGRCMAEGELGKRLDFTAWKDSDSDLEKDQSEKFVKIRGWMQLRDQWNFLGSFSPDSEKRIAVRWKLPENTSNAVQKDSVTFDLLLSAQKDRNDGGDGSGKGDEEDNSGGEQGGGEFSSTDSLIKTGKTIESSGSGEDSKIGETDSAVNDTREEDKQSVLRIQVTDESGDPVENAKVEISGPEELTGRTNTTGYAVFEVRPGEYSVNVSRENYGRKSNTVSVEDEEIEGEKISLDRKPNPENNNAAGAFFRGSGSIALGLLILIIIALMALKRSDYSLPER